MSKPASRVDLVRAWCAHAFAVDPADGFEAEEEALATRVAGFVVRRRLTAPALMALETGRPLNFIGSQFLVFLSPFLTLIFSPPEYDRFCRFLGKRPSIDIIIGKILDQENERLG